MHRWLTDVQSIIANVWVQFAFGLILLVVGWKMNANSANGVLFVAWAILATCVFRSPWMIQKDIVLRCLITMFFAGAFGLIIYNLLWTRAVTPAAPAFGPPPVIQQIAGDLIEGTRITRAQLDRAFPEGWVIFSKRFGQLAYQPLQSDRLKFKADWSTVDIVSDPQSKWVAWILPSDITTMKDSKPGFVISESFINQSIPYNEQIAYRWNVFSSAMHDPSIWLATISTDPNFPVFLLGFRIPTGPDERQFRLPW